jgi:hypothetical protein
LIGQNLIRKIALESQNSVDSQRAANNRWHSKNCR